jgi:hypothetical protein
MLKNSHDFPQDERGRMSSRLNFLMHTVDDARRQFLIGKGQDATITGKALEFYYSYDDAVAELKTKWRADLSYVFSDQELQDVEAKGQAFIEELNRASGNLQ